MNEISKTDMVLHDQVVAYSCGTYSMRNAHLWF